VGVALGCEFVSGVAIPARKINKTSHKVVTIAILLKLDQSAHSSGVGTKLLHPEVRHWRISPLSLPRQNCAKRHFMGP